MTSFVKTENLRVQVSPAGPRSPVAGESCGWLHLMGKGAVISPFHKLVCIESPEETVGEDEGSEGPKEKSCRGDRRQATTIAV